MKYLVLVYAEEAKLDALSDHEFQSLVQESLAYDEVMRKSGHYVASDALQSVRTAASVRVRDGRVFVTDGPFAETKEQLLGFILIDAKDRDDAIAVAAGFPVSRLGTIEVRPVLELGEDTRGLVPEGSAKNP
jgi:hypothetical protein